MIKLKDLNNYNYPNRIIYHDKISLQVQPNKNLSNFISHYNIVFPKKDIFTTEYTLIPNASATLSFALKDNSIISELWGAFTHAIKLGSEPEEYKMLLLIELRPQAIYKLTKTASHTFTNKRILLSLINQELNNKIINQIKTASTITNLIDNLDIIFKETFLNYKLPNSISTAISLIISSTGSMEINKLVKLVNMSERHLNRLFKKYIGMNIKTFSRVVRINYTISMLQNNKSSLTELSYISGYFDQSHFINDFKKICNTTPSLYKRNMSVFYNDTEFF